MGIKEISKQELLNLIFDNKSIGAGSFGEVFELDKQNLFKFYYEKFSIERTQKEISRLYRNLEWFRQDLYKIQNTVIYKIMQKYGTIKGAAVPKELVFVEGALVGCMLDKVNGTNIQCAMAELGTDNAVTKRKIEENLFDAYTELTSNGIFPFDIKGDNVIVNTKTGEAKVIDLDDAYTMYYDNLSEQDFATQKGELMRRLDTMFAWDIEKIPVLEASNYKFKR